MPPIGFDGGTVLTFTLQFNNNTGHGIGRPRLSVSTAPSPAALDGECTAPESVLALLARLDTEPNAKLTDDKRAGVCCGGIATLDPGWRG